MTIKKEADTMEYTVAWKEENWYKVRIEAKSIEEAKELFWAGEFDSAGVKHTGTEIQDDVDIFDDSRVMA